MDQLIALRERLLGQAYLFDQPEAYAAGVDDALAEVARLRIVDPSLTIDLSGDVASIRLAAN